MTKLEPGDEVLRHVQKSVQVAGFCEIRVCTEVVGTLDVLRVWAAGTVGERGGACRLRQQGAPIRVSLFDDRIEIENPGVLLAGLTIDDIRQGISRLRNRVIGRVFKELGYLEQWGSGIQRATAECEAGGLSVPEFEERGFRFRVTVRLEKHRAAQWDETDAHIRKLFTSETPAAKNGLSTAQIATAVKLTTRSLRTRMGKLVEQGLVTVVGKNERDPQRKYYWRS